jgi:hypothetical protein
LHQKWKCLATTLQARSPNWLHVYRWSREKNAHGTKMSCASFRLAAKFAVVVIDRETRFRRSSRRTACPGKTSLTSWSKGASSRLAIMLARRAGCHESGSSGSREARRSNPRSLASVVLRRDGPKVIPAFYPIPFLGKRATGTLLATSTARLSWFKAGEGSAARFANPALGVRTKVPLTAQIGWKSRQVRSTRPAWGVSVWRQAEPGS